MINGCHKDLLYNHKVRCKRCSGLRTEPGAKLIKCWSCHGKGSVIFKIGPEIIHELCDDCKGTG